MNAMVTRVVLATVLLLIPILAFGQIPNGGFENWTAGALDGWFINNIPPLYATCSATADAHSGSQALYGVVVSSIAGNAGPTIQSGVDGTGFAYAQRPTAFTGWYKFSPQAGDRFGVNVGLFKGGVEGTAVGIAAIAPSAAVSSYTQFTANFVYQTADVPDVCVVQIMIVGPDVANAVPHVGSNYFLDDIAL